MKEWMEDVQTVIAFIYGLTLNNQGIYTTEEQAELHHILVRLVEIADIGAGRQA